MSDKKYYGGAVCYFVKSRISEEATSTGTEEYYDILKGEYSSFVPKIDSRTLRSKDSEGESSDSTYILAENKLPNSYDYIQRMAFGQNKDGTCSAIATQIALTYIALQNNMALIPNNYVPETLNNGKPNDDRPISAIYPQAHQFHRYIADDCGMGKASIAGTISGSFSKYYFKTVPIFYLYNLSLQARILPSYEKIRKNIDNGKPVLISTLWGAEYEYHTMCVYGYRFGLDYSTQLLVHLGWHSNNDKIGSSDKILFQSEIWISADDAAYAYYFSYENPLAGFTDIPRFTNWAYPGIAFVFNAGIMSGTSASTFSPNLSMTRAMLVATLYRMEGSPTVSGSSSFSDVPESSWYTDSVIWAAENNIVSGVGSGKFDPNGKITREQLAVILYRYAKHCSYDTSNRASLTSFSDYSSVSSYAKTAMSWAVAEGLISGTTVKNKLFLTPQSSATRAQVATILMRFAINIVN